LDSEIHQYQPSQMKTAYREFPITEEDDALLKQANDRITNLRNTVVKLKNNIKKCEEWEMSESCIQPSRDMRKKGISLISVLDKAINTFKKDGKADSYKVLFSLMQDALVFIKDVARNRVH